MTQALFRHPLLIRVITLTGEEGKKAVSCRGLLLGDCCQGRNDKLFGSANNNQADG